MLKWLRQVEDGSCQRTAVSKQAAGVAWFLLSVRRSAGCTPDTRCSFSEAHWLHKLHTWMPAETCVLGTLDIALRTSRHTSNLDPCFPGRLLPTHEREVLSGSDPQLPVWLVL